MLLLPWAAPAFGHTGFTLAHPQALHDASDSTLMHTLRRHASRVALNMSIAGGQALGQEGPHRRRSSGLKSEDVRVSEGIDPKYLLQWSVCWVEGHVLDALTRQGNTRAFSMLAS